MLLCRDALYSVIGNAGGCGGKISALKFSLHAAEGEPTLKSVSKLMSDKQQYYL